MESNVTASREANRLYWQTDRSVADIATALGVSRRALYELIEPAVTAVSCGACGTRVVFANRSAKASGMARCPQCGSEADVEDSADAHSAVPPYAAGWPRSGESDDGALRARAIKIGGAAMAGAAMGALAALLIVRRR